MNETTTNLSDIYSELFAGTLVLRTNMTLGITDDIIQRYLAYSVLATHLLDETSPEMWSDAECDGIGAIVNDLREIGTEIKEHLMDQLDEQEEMEG